MPKDTLMGDGLEGRLSSKPSSGVGEWMRLRLWGVRNGSKNDVCESVVCGSTTLCWDNKGAEGTSGQDDGPATGSSKYKSSMFS